uniref:DUF2201 family putative metallopeptidase n=1 Tax=Mesorhizobium silamurunense TaxID=499528 RepID=UPI001FE9795E
MNAEAEKRIVRARSILLQTAPFYGALALYLKLQEAPELTDTAATDGAHFFYNAPWILSLSEPELLFVVAHEVSHLSHGHHARLGRRDLSDFNRAADYAMNAGLIAAKIGKMPQGMLFDPQYDGMGAEEIYSILQRKARKAKEQQSQSGQAGGAGAGAGQSGKPGDGKPDQSGKPGQADNSGAPGQAADGGGKPADAGKPNGAPAGQSGAPAPGNGQSGGNGQEGAPAPATGAP